MGASITFPSDRLLSSESVSPTEHHPASLNIRQLKRSRKDSRQRSTSDLMGLRHSAFIGNATWWIFPAPPHRVLRSQPHCSQTTVRNFVASFRMRLAAPP